VNFCLLRKRLQVDKQIGELKYTMAYAKEAHLYKIKKYYY